MDTQVAAVGRRVNALSLSPRLWAWVGAIALGGFFEIYDLALTGPLSAGLIKEHIFRTGHAGIFGLADQATFIAATFIGLYLGVLAFAALGDRLGRRFVFTASLLWYAAATVLMGMQSDAASICFWRFVAGVGVGAEALAIDCYIVEIVPHRSRGRVFALSMALQYCAIPVGALLAAWLIPQGLYGISGWRWLTFVPALGAVVFWFARRSIPESPMWLASRGRAAEANKILDKLPSRAGAELLNTAPLEATADAPDNRRYVVAATIVMLIYFNLQAVAYFGFSNWLPTLLEARGVPLRQSLFYTAGVALASPVAPLLLALIADRFERKHLIVVAGLASTLFGLAFAAASAPTAWLLFGLGLALSNSILSVNSHNYLSEIYPIRIRARLTGFVYSFTRIAAAISGYVIAFVLAEAGPIAVFVVISGCMGLALAAVAIGGPRVRRVQAVS
jgi:MFS transporter, putative metabolite:H+ symporter